MLLSTFGDVFERKCPTDRAESTFSVDTHKIRADFSPRPPLPPCIDSQPAQPASLNDSPATRPYLGLDGYISDASLYNGLYYMDTVSYKTLVR